jgi:hypothetical protein
MKRSYTFISRWQLRAPVQEIWETIRDSEKWPEWWKGVDDVTEIEPGDEAGIGSVRKYTLSSPAKYKLCFNLQLTERIEYKLLKGNATGDLQGTGAWHFAEDRGITYVECHWYVVTTLPWMNFLSIILAPLFRYNHSVVMSWGAKSLARKLNAELISY